MAQQHNNPFLWDALYCEEEHSEGAEEDETPPTTDPPENDAEESFYSDFTDPKLVFPLKQDLNMEDDEEELNSLYSKEKENELYNVLKENRTIAAARAEAVDWILKVTVHFSFSAQTALLAINYLDRYLLKFQSHIDKPWLTQLAAVACLSVAAKVEETQVPFLLDLQVEEYSKCVFEVKTIQRMETSVLSTLEWKMYSATPFSFLDYIVRRVLRLKNHLSWDFLRRCEHLLLSVISDWRFMNHRPSIIAAATMLHVINSIDPCFTSKYHDQLLGFLGTSKEKVDECRGLIQEVASEVSFRSSKKRKNIGAMPGSPTGVMDVSFSSDSSNDSWAVAASASSSPEPLSSKRKCWPRMRGDEDE